MIQNLQMLVAVFEHMVGFAKERIVQWEANHPQIDPRFLFASMGYNVRMTEISGAIGMHQVDRIEGFVKQRSDETIINAGVRW